MASIRVLALALAFAACKPPSSSPEITTPTPEPTTPTAEPAAPTPEQPATPPKPRALPCGDAQCAPPESCLEGPGMDANGPTVVKKCGIRCDPHAATSGCPSDMICVPEDDGPGPHCVIRKR